MEGNTKENQLQILNNFKKTTKTSEERKIMDPKQDNPINQATIRDLCPTDKARIRQLVEDLARLGAEKDEIESQRKKEKDDLEEKMYALRKKQSLLMKEKATLEENLKDTKKCLETLHENTSTVNTNIPKDQQQQPQRLPINSNNNQLYTNTLLESPIEWTVPPLISTDSKDGMSTVIPTTVLPTTVLPTTVLPSTVIPTSSTYVSVPSMMQTGPLLPCIGGPPSYCGGPTMLSSVSPTLLPCPPVVPSVIAPLPASQQPVYSTVNNEGHSQVSSNDNYHHFSFPHFNPSRPPFPHLSQFPSHSNVSTTYTPLKPHPLPSSLNWQSTETHPLIDTPTTPHMSCDPVQSSDQSDCPIIRKDASIQTSDSFCEPKEKVVSPPVMRRKIKSIVTPQKDVKKSFSTPFPEREKHYYNKTQDKKEKEITSTIQEEEEEMLSVLLNSQTLATSLVLMKQGHRNNNNNDDRFLSSPSPPPPSPLSLASPLPSFTTLQELTSYTHEEEYEREREREGDNDDDTEIINELFFL